jgi:predicted Zn-dependent protease
MKLLARPVLPILLLVLAGCAQARKPGEEIKPGFNLFSARQELELGQAYAEQIRREKRPARSAELQEYVARLGRRLAAAPEAGNYPYSFEVIEEPSINAFALPGGPIFVHTGLIAAAANEAQLAGVLAHEIAHVALRHGTNQATKSILVQLSLSAAGILSGRDWIAQLGALGVMPLLLNFSRSAETQADLLGARILARAGYDPQEMARFFETLEESGSGGKLPQFLSSHPKPGNRQQAIEREILALAAGPARSSSASFERMRAHAAAASPGNRQPVPHRQWTPPSEEADTSQHERRRLRAEGSSIEIQQGQVAPQELWEASEAARAEVGAEWAVLFAGRSWKQAGGRNVAVTRLKSVRSDGRHGVLFAWRDRGATRFALASGFASHARLEQELERLLVH